MHSFSYLAWLLLRPSVRDYTSMGWGIAARHARCRAYWRHHLHECGAVLRNALEEGERPVRVGILGAGRLYDIDLAQILEASDDVTLFDADPSCRFSWMRKVRRLRDLRRVRFVERDLTGSIGQWTKSLRQALGDRGTVDLSRIAALLESLQPGDPPDVGGFDCLLSMNLLSQIPLYWRDRVHAELGRFSIAADDQGKLPGRIQQGLEASCRRLQALHLRSLATSGASRIALVTDTQCCYYHDASAEWLVEPAVRVPLELPGYVPVNDRSWWWDIAPQGIEERDYGVVHRVRGAVFRRLA